MKPIVTKYFLSSLFMLTMFVAARAQNPGHQILGTIKPGASANQVDIYLKPDYSNTTEYFTNMVITIALPTSTATPTLTVTNSYIPTFPVANWASGAQAVETIGSYKVFAYNVVRTGTTPYAFTGGTEFKAATISFSGNPNAVQVRLADYTTEHGGNSNYAYFYVETNVSSQVSNSTSANMFYASPTYSTTGTQGTDGYSQTINTVTLPITWSSFSGISDGCSARLVWQTAMEYNSGIYEVQYGTDGATFRAVGSVASQNKALGASYAYTYPGLAAGTGYFRVRAVDKDGTFSYSAIIAVTGSGACGAGLGIKAWPNPTRGLVYVQNLTAGSRLSLMDESGKVLGQFIAGGTGQSVDISNYASGAYLLRVQGADGGITNLKLVKQ